MRICEEAPREMEMGEAGGESRTRGWSQGEREREREGEGNK
jgi:hypothetical protein